MNTKTIIKTYKAHEQSILLALCGAFLALLVAYMYFVSASVVHVVIRKEVNQEMTKLHTEIALLEAEYIKAQHGISTDIASLQGFVETPDKIFLDRTPTSLVLGTNR